MHGMGSVRERERERYIYNKRKAQSHKQTRTPRVEKEWLLSGQQFRPSVQWEGEKHVMPGGGPICVDAPIMIGPSADFLPVGVSDCVCLYASLNNLTRRSSSEAGKRSGKRARKCGFNI